jgi:hypothetical protein
MRVQALRQKREAIEAAANQHAWARHLTEQSVLGVVDPATGPLQTASAKVAPVATRVRAPAACVDRRVADNLAENVANSHDTAFETWLSAQPWNLGSAESGETDLRELGREVMAKSHLPSRELPANRRESPERAGYGCHIDGETAST